MNDVTASDDGIDGVAWLRRHCHRFLFKQAMSLIAQDISDIRNMYHIVKSEIRVYLAFTDASHTRATLSFKGRYRRQDYELRKRSIEFVVSNDKVYGIRFDPLR